MSGLLKEFFRFAWREKKWWLIPLAAICLLLLAVMLLSGGSGISWSIYR